MFEKEFLEAFEKGDLQYQEDHINDIYWDEYFVLHYILPEEFMAKYGDELDWNMISAYQQLSEEFIEKYQDKVGWGYISFHQKLSYRFISLFYNKLNLGYLLQNEHISQDIKDKLIKLQIFK